MSNQYNQNECPEWSKLSPAPWVAVRIMEGKWHVHRAGYGDATIPVAVVDHSRDGHAPTRLQAEFDAKLIAAAPEMLEALRQSLNWLSSYPGGLSLECYDQARAAIDKAEGRE